MTETAVTSHWCSLEWAVTWITVVCKNRRNAH